MVCLYIIGDLIVITVMYFDAYLKGRNAPPSHPHPQQISQVATEASSKFNMLRPPNIQPTSITAKSPFPESRNDHYQQNTSAHIFLSAAKPPSVPQRVASNYPIRQQTSAVSLAAFSRHQMPEEQKYICHSPGKGGSRTSAGLVFEQIPQNRYDYRRSESINEVKPSVESFRDSSINYYPQGRQSNEYIDARNSTFSNSQLQLRFNPYPEKGKASRKESVEGALLTNRQERAQPPTVKQPYSQKKIFKEYSQLFQYKPQIPSFDPNKFEYISARNETQPKKYDFQTRKFQAEGKRSDAYKNFEEVYRNSLQIVLDGSDLKRQNSQDFLKKYSNSKLPDLDKSLEQDIETLRFTSRKSDEIVDRQLSKNNYLNQLFEQRGVKPAEQRPQLKETLKQKKEAAARNIAFERELEERNRENTQMKKQIEEKDKVIVDKNKKIKEISAQLKEFQQNISKKQYKLAQLQKNHKNQLANIQKRLNQSVSKVVQLQNKIKENQQIFNLKLQQKDKVVNLLQSSQEQYKSKVQSLQNQLDNATKSVQINQKTIEEYQKKSIQLTASLNSLKQQFQAQKLSLISLYKKQNAQLKAKFESERDIQHKSKEEGTGYLQAELLELKKRNNLLQEQLLNLTKEHKEKQQKYDIVYGQYLEIGTILLLPQGFSHQKLIFELKQCLQSLARSEGIQAKEAQRLQQYQIQKLQQEHLQRRHQELSRQLKKVGSRLAGASIQAQQGVRLLREANQTIVSMNLLNLNEKYKFLLENQ